MTPEHRAELAEAEALRLVKSLRHLEAENRQLRQALRESERSVNWLDRGLGEMTACATRLRAEVERKDALLRRTHWWTEHAWNCPRRSGDEGECVCNHPDPSLSFEIRAALSPSPGEPEKP